MQSLVRQAASVAVNGTYHTSRLSAAASSRSTGLLLSRRHAVLHEAKHVRRRVRGPLPWRTTAAPPSASSSGWRSDAREIPEAGQVLQTRAVHSGQRLSARGADAACSRAGHPWQSLTCARHLTALHAGLPRSGSRRGGLPYPLRTQRQALSGLRAGSCRTVRVRGFPHQ